MTFLKPKFLLKAVWFGFGLAGLVIIIQTYAPNLLNRFSDSSLVKGIETELAQNTGTGGDSDSSVDPTQIDPGATTQAITKVIVQEVTKIIQENTETIKTLPAQQVRKIKIGACEELLEEDICAVASELECSL